MIEMTDIVKSFSVAGKDIPILKGISLYVGKGEYVSIMGPSGSGKSTLSSILGCLARPTSGTYKLDGKDVGGMNSKELSRLRNQQIGFIFQDFNLLDGLSAADNVALPLFYAGVPQRQRRGLALTSLKTVGLEHRANHMANILSGGEKQRVAIARALVCEPAFLFADEPTGALDKRTGQEIMALIQRLNLLGHTVVQVTHSPSDANYSKRILHLMDGLIVKDEIVERPTIGAISQETADRYSGELQARFWRIAQNTSVHSQENFEALRALLDKTPSQEGLVEAVKALVRWEGKEVEEILRSLARHEQWPVRAEVLRLSRTLPGNFWAEQCFEHLSDTNAWVRYLALQTIKQALPIALTAVWRESLVKCIQDDDERVRATAVAILGVLKEPGFFDPILAATDDRDGRVRANALESLASYFIDEEKAKSVMAQVETHLEDRHNRARANAVVIVSGSNMPLALETVAQMIVSENNLMRASAAWALGFLKEGAATQLLIDAIKIEKEELVVTQLVRALGQHTKHSLPLKEQLHHILDEREAA